MLPTAIFCDIINLYFLEKKNRNFLYLGIMPTANLSNFIKLVHIQDWKTQVPVGIFGKFSHQHRDP